MLIQIGLGGVFGHSLARVYGPATRGAGGVRAGWLHSTIYKKARGAQDDAALSSAAVPRPSGSSLMPLR